MKIVRGNMTIGPDTTTQAGFSKARKAYRKYPTVTRIPARLVVAIAQLIAGR